MDLNGLSFNVPQLTKVLQKRRPVLHIARVLFLASPKHSDQPHSIVLRSCSKRPSHRCAAEKCHELAPTHVHPPSRGDGIVAVQTSSCIEAKTPPRTRHRS